MREYLYLTVIGFLIAILIVTFFKYKKTDRELAKVKKELAKIESAKDASILIDSVKYEKTDEIWKKDIVIDDTLITDNRTLYLVNKYGGK